MSERKDVNGNDKLEMEKELKTRCAVQLLCPLSIFIPSTVSYFWTVSIWISKIKMSANRDTASLSVGSVRKTEIVSFSAHLASTCIEGFARVAWSLQFSGTRNAHLKLCFWTALCYASALGQTVRTRTCRIPVQSNSKCLCWFSGSSGKNDTCCRNYLSIWEVIYKIRILFSFNLFGHTLSWSGKGM